MMEETHKMSDEALHNAVSDFYAQSAHCQTMEGKHFEHIL